MAGFKFVILIVILISDSLTHILEKGLSQLIKNILGTDTKYSWQLETMWKPFDYLIKSQFLIFPFKT